MRLSAPHSRHPRASQRGMVALVTLLFLIATVVFALAQMLNVSSGGVIEGQRLGDSSAALFLAESGLDKARASTSSALAAFSYTDATCTGVAGSYALGRGTVTLSAVSTPASCDNATTLCTACTVTATGQVGLATRKVTQELGAVPGGVSCNGAYADCRTGASAWKLNLRNTSATMPGIGVFATAFQGKTTSYTAACPNPSGANCRQQFQVPLTLATGNNGALLGHTVLPVAAPTNTAMGISQTFNGTGTNIPDVVEVGGLFLGSGSGPALTGPNTNAGAASYWDNRTAQTTSRTAAVGTSSATPAATTGGTNDGTAGATSSCAAPGATNQTCTSWCWGGDTLVFSFAANVASVSNQLTGVTFGTNALQTVPLTFLSRYSLAKAPSSSTYNMPASVDAEIWYARNPNLTPASTPQATGVSSYKGRGTGAVGAQWTASDATTAISGTTLTVGAGFVSAFPYPQQLILPGDTLSNTGTATSVAPGTTIVRQISSTETGGGLGGRGTYEVSVSQTVAGVANSVWTVQSNVLNVSACSTCFFAQNDPVALATLSPARSINGLQATTSSSYGRTEAAGGVGRYPLSGAATRVAPTTTLSAGTPDNTLYLPATSSQPTLTVPPMRIAVKSGTGALAAGTTVTSIPQAVGIGGLNRFSVNSPPTTPLDNATVCAGTCAFFVPGTNTTFSLAFNTPLEFYSWSAGFTCLKGVTQDPQPVRGTFTTPGYWSESVQ